MLVFPVSGSFVILSLMFLKLKRNTVSVFCFLKKNTTSKNNTFLIGKSSKQSGFFFFPPTGPPSGERKGDGKRSIDFITH